MPPPQNRGQRTMLKFLGATCWEARELAGLKISEIAGPLKADGGTIRKFERGESWPTKLGVDRVIAVYAQETRIHDGREIWLTSATRFAKHGSPPLVHPDQEPDLLAEAEAEADALSPPDDRTSQQPEEDLRAPESDDDDDGQEARRRSA